MLEQRIQQHFFDSADLKVQSAEALARPILAAAQAMVEAITAGSKVMAWGQGVAHHDAARFVEAMLGHFERERPALAATLLGSPGINSTHALRHMQAVAQAGDVLLLVLDVDGARNPPTVTAASVKPPATTLPTTSIAPVDEAVAWVDAARDKDLSIVLLGGKRHEAAAMRLGETDVVLIVNHERCARVQEVLNLALHCMLDTIDHELLGDDEERVI